MRQRLLKRTIVARGLSGPPWPILPPQLQPFWPLSARGMLIYVRFLPDFFDIFKEIVKTIPFGQQPYPEFSVWLIGFI